VGVGDVGYVDGYGFFDVLSALGAGWLVDVVVVGVGFAERYFADVFLGADDEDIVVGSVPAFDVGCPTGYVGWGLAHCPANVCWWWLSHPMVAFPMGQIFQSATRWSHTSTAHHARES
jgi:hypothetical protein